MKEMEKRIRMIGARRLKRKVSCWKKIRIAMIDYSKMSEAQRVLTHLGMICAKKKR